MPGKGKKKRNSKDSTNSGNSGSATEAAGKKKKGGKKKGGSGSAKFQSDIFNEGAMENAYCVCHNVQVTNNSCISNSSKITFIIINI